MNTRRVSSNAARKLGMSTTLIFASLIGLRPVSAAQIVITVKGTSNGGRDMFHIFGPSDIKAGMPFLLVFTFDDKRGAAMKGSPCSGAGSGIAGGNGGSPGTAVLTIGAKSYTFGQGKDARSRTWRATNSRCSRSEIGINIEEGDGNFPSGVQIKIRPNYGKSSLTQDDNWRHELRLNDFDARNGDNVFAIRQRGNYGAQTMSYLSVESVTVK